MHIQCIYLFFFSFDQSSAMQRQIIILRISSPRRGMLFFFLENEGKVIKNPYDVVNLLFL